jgi:DNA-binding transcriptional regulator PaaX
VGLEVVGVWRRERWWRSWGREYGTKEESGRAAWQRMVEGNDLGWIIREATGNKSEWVASANGMAPI